MGWTQLLPAPAGKAHFGKVPVDIGPGLRAGRERVTPRAPHSSGEIPFPTSWACPEPQGFLLPPQEPLLVSFLQGGCSGHSRVSIPQQESLIHGLLARHFLLLLWDALCSDSSPAFLHPQHSQPCPSLSSAQPQFGTTNSKAKVGTHYRRGFKVLLEHKTFSFLKR